MERETAKTYLREGNKLKRLGKLKEAIASYRQAIKINPYFCWSYHYLGEALAKNGILDEAIVSFLRAIEINPNLAWSHYELGEVFASKGEFDTAIVNYHRACEMEPDFQRFYKGLERAISQYRVDTINQKRLGNLDKAIAGYRKVIEIKPLIDDYCQLGVLLVETKQQWNEALLCYEKLLEVQPWNGHQVKPFLSLGVALVKAGKLQKVIDSYHNVFQKNIENLFYYWQIGAHLANLGFLTEAVRFFEEFPKPQLPKQEKKELLKASGDISKYDLIWDWFNSNNSQDQEFDLDIDIDGLKLEGNQVNEHFQNKKISVFFLPHLTEKEKILLRELGVSVEYMNVMRKEEKGVENVYLNLFKNENSSNNSGYIQRNVLYPLRRFRCWHRINNPVEFPHTIAEFKYLYCLDPTSGKIVRSNESFFWGSSIVYRFQGREIFYIIVGGWSGDKISLYIPRFNVAIYYTDWDVPTTNVQIFQDFQCLIVTYFKDVLKYLNSSNSRKLTSCIGFINNLGHYFWQDLNGIYYSYKNHLLENIDNFAVGDYEKMELISVMPEIPDSKILKVLKMSESEKFQFFLKNNCFCFRITEHFISSECMNRVQKVAWDKCSADLRTILTGIKENQESFPLLWINVRSHNKSWISQEKGYAKIINKLSDSFPNLGIVFDGWVDCNEVVENIQKQLKANIKIYNTLGCPLHESISWGYYIDAYIAVVGSGLTVTSWVNDKPGVTYANKGHLVQKRFWSQVKEKAIAPHFLEPEDIVDIGTSGWSNYELDWQVIYKKTLPILQQIKQKNNN
ncbi:tetratricopeptide repeat protein [Dapis sp. BLCC M126]|uniref:tetratricopeptide repeat protein n=1 Tax=Dapis sp. BLCC M126 TaxID=3400189 RepID=UPI003CF99FEF